MSYKEQFCCDVCSTEKKETNHWFVATLDERDYGPLSGPTLHVAPFCASDAKRAGVATLCGEQCIGIYVHRQLKNLVVMSVAS